MNIQHQALAQGGWQELSLAEQLGNIGGEISRALKWRDRDENLYQSAIKRAFELIDLTLEDPRLRGRLKEIARLREFLADAILDGGAYGSKLEDIDRYLFQFALAARKTH